MKKYKMLFAGESWLTHNMEVKGWDDFSVGGYGTEIDRIHAAMDEFAEITHLPPIWWERNSPLRWRS